MTSLSKADYLKRYLSAEDGNSGSDLKKKKKKKEKSSKQRVGMRIVEDDAFASVAAGAGEKKVIASDEEEEIEMIQELVKTKIQAPKFKNAFTTVETPTSSSVPSKRHDSDSDPEPPRRRRHDSDKSPPRRRRHDSDEDSPPKSTRRRRNDSDQSPVRHSNSNGKDESPVRKRGRHDSGSSPPRSRKRHDSDDQEPPRRGARNEDQSPPRRTRRDSDASPPRRRLQSPCSPPPRNGRRVQSPTVEKEKMATTLDGKVAGLQTAKALKEESDKLRQRETMLFEEMDTATSGRGADTVVRQKQIKRGRREEPEDKEKKEREAKKQEELTSKYKDWNRGVKQLQEREAQLNEMARVAAEPVARRADDDEMNRHLKEVIHEADPMAAMITRRKREDAIDRGDLVYPQYTRPYPPNRFHIRPGYRWDGVDRSNGFEGKLAMAGNKKKAQNTEFYQNIQCYE